MAAVVDFATRPMGVGGLMPRHVIEDDLQSFKAEIDRLREEHRDLDAAIEALTLLGGIDQLQVQRLKKRKLVLRDRISYLEDQITPDIIA